MNSVFQQLKEQIRHIESGGRIDDGEVVGHDCAAIDRLLPEGGYSRGTLVQWITGGGMGADHLSLRVAREACRDGGALVVIDPHHEFFPPAAAALGINLDNLIVLRTDETRSENDLLWAIDQSLGCAAVAAVWGPIANIDERWFRRFQLSAEASGCLGLFLQPPLAAKRPTWAEVQWLVGMSSDRLSPDRAADQSAVSLQDQSPSQFMAEQITTLQLTRCRGTHTGKSIRISINHITGEVQPVRRTISQPIRHTQPVLKKSASNNEAQQDRQAS